MNRKANAPVRLSGERRHVTALFYDIVDSTEVLVRSDPDKFYASLKEFHKASEAIIRRHGGFIHHKLGDGACCYFGYPDQSEGAAEKAVRAAFELIERLSLRRRTQAGPFKIRIGVATGIVLISSDGQEIVGTAPVLASRLQARAQPNMVAVADSTHDLTLNTFEYSAAEHVDIKGFDGPVPIWRPIAIKQPTSRSAIGFKSNQLQGRGDELSLLLSAARKASTGTAQSIAIFGEPGVGKSRLISELQNAVEQGGGSTFRMQCEPDLTSRPMQPFLAFVESILGSGSLQTKNAEELATELRSAGIQVKSETATVISSFAGEKVRIHAGSIRVQDITGQVLRQEMIHAAIDLLTSSMSDQLSLYVIEDVDWADAMTTEFLDQLVSRLAALPVLIVQSSRREVLSRAPLSVKLVLSALDSDAVHAMVNSIWKENPPVGLPAFVMEKSDGIPLFVEELTQFLKRHRKLATNSVEWNRVLHDHGVSSLNDILSARLADVGTARRVAQIASVVGRDFSVGLLEHLLEEGLEASALDRDIEALVASGIVEWVNESTDTYRFRHALIHEAAYASLLHSDSRRIHRRIGHLLLAEHVEGMSADRAAWQCAQGGLHQDAAIFALQAAESCVLRSAMREAEQMLELAAQELDASPRSAKNQDLRLDLLQLRGVVFAALLGEGSRKTRAVYSTAMRLLKHGATSNQAERFPLYWGWWFTAENTRTQQSRAEVLVEDMRTAEDSEVRLQSFHCAWATSFHAAQHDYCLACVAKGLELYDADRALRNRAFYGGHDAKVCGLGESALSNLLLAETELSEDAIKKCLEWSAETDHIGSIVHGLYYAVVLRRCTGDYEAVIDIADRMLSLATEHGLTVISARANMYGGWARAMSGSVVDGWSQFVLGRELQAKMGADDNLSIHIDMHADLLQLLGQPEEGLKVIDSGISAGTSVGQRFWLAELYRRRSEFQLLLGHDQRLAKKDLRRSIRLAQSQRAIWLRRRSENTLNLLKDGVRVGPRL